MKLLLIALFNVFIVAFIIFVLKKIRKSIPDKYENLFLIDETPLFIIDKQSPTYFINCYMSILFWLDFILWINKDYNDTGAFIGTILFSLLFLFAVYIFLNSFFIKLIITNKRVLYRNLFNIKYKKVFIKDILKVNCFYSYQYGAELIITIKENLKTMNFLVIKEATEAQKILNKLIMLPEELKNLAPEKEKSITPWELAMLIILTLIFIIIKIN